MTTVPLNTPAQITAATFRGSRGAVYNQIVSDLVDATKSNLPVRQPAVIADMRRCRPSTACSGRCT